MTAATRHALAAVAAAVAILAAGAAPAHALAPAITQNADDVYALAEKGGLPSGRLPVACGPTCATLWESEHALIPGQPTSAAIHNELNGLRTQTKLLPKLGSVAGTTLSRVSLGVGAFTAGWQIGTALRSIFVSDRGGNVAASPSSGYTYFPLPIGREVFIGEAGRITGNPYVVSPQPNDPIIPAPGWVHGTSSGASPTVSITGTGAGSTDAGCPGHPSYAPRTAPAPWTVVVGECSYNGVNSWGFRYTAWRAGSLTVTEALPDGTTQQGSRIDWPAAGQGTNGEPTATTKQRLVDELTTHPERYPNLLPWLEQQLTPQHVTVPSCAGLSWTACRDALLELDLVPHRDTLTFATSDLTKPAGAVVTVERAGDELDVDSDVTVTTNPDADDMPLAMPAPEPGETYDAYVARLTAEGWHGTATRVDLTDATLDPQRGPNAVTTTTPQAGGRVRPDGDVTIRVNPATAPAVPIGGGGPEIDAIDLSPLNVQQACTNFPLGVPCWAVEAVSAWVVQGDVDAPRWTIPFPFVAEADYPTLDLEDWQEPATVLRALILAVATLGIALRFFSFATGTSRGGDGDD